jgi:hypothetical protein
MQKKKKKKKKKKKILVFFFVSNFVVHEYKIKIIKNVK